MTLITWLVLSHLIGDYFLQTEYEALNKAQGRFWNRALWSHCLKYTLALVPVVWLMDVDFVWLAIVFGTHLVLDRRWVVLWWRRAIMRGSEAGIQNTFWLTIVVDQIFHLLVLAAMASWPTF